MRKASIVLAIAACAASSMAPAQHRAQPTGMSTPAGVDASATESTTRAKSGFGQVMSVLTTLLQDAATKEAAGTSSTAADLLSAEASAVSISVTPVAGSSTFFVNNPSSGIGSARRATTPVAASGQGAQMAVQAVPD